MTDDALDRRLRAAGEAWRAAEAGGAEPAAGAAGPAAGPGGAGALVLAPHRHRPWLLLASAAVLVAALVAGGFALWSGGDRRPVQTGPASIGTSTWRAVSTEYRGRHEAPTPDARITFAGGRYTGSDGCNGLQGTARIGAATVVLRPTGVHTDIGCSGAEPIDTVLSGTLRYTVTATRLTLRKQGVGAVVYERQAPAQALAGRWRLVSVETTHESGGTSSGSGSVAAEQVLLSISGGRYTVSGTCLAAARGTVVGTRTAATFTNTDRTFRSCPLAGSATGTERALLAEIFAGTGRGTVTGTELTVTHGPRSAIFTRVP